MFSFRNGQVVSIRTFILSDQGIFKIEDEETERRCKPTLVMIHGFGAAACVMYPVFKPLIEHFRIVTFDMLGFGASSRVAMREEILSSQSACDNY